MRHTRIIVTHYGGPDALKVVEEECPDPKGGEVRVKVLAAGVSLPDVLARDGVHPETPRVPYTPGWDLVGIVDREFFFECPARDSENQQSSVEGYLDDLQRIRIEVRKV